MGVSERKISKGLSLTPSQLAAVLERARAAGVNFSEYVCLLIERDLARSSGQLIVGDAAQTPQESKLLEIFRQAVRRPGSALGTLVNAPYLQKKPPTEKRGRRAGPAPPVSPPGPDVSAG